MFGRGRIAWVMGFVLCAGLAVGLALSNAATSSAVVIPAEPQQAHVFPPGKYILGGGPQPARGRDILEIHKPFTLRPGQYILSGGPAPSERIVVDDDLEVSAGGKLLFVDDDHVASTELRPGWPCSYDGTPIIFVLDPKSKLCIQAIDHCASEAILGALYLHRHDGAKRRLNERRAESSDPNLPHVFFREAFDLAQGFEASPPIKEVLQMPECPASLLPPTRDR